MVGAVCKRAGQGAAPRGPGEVLVSGPRSCGDENDKDTSDCPGGVTRRAFQGPLPATSTPTGHSQDLTPQRPSPRGKDAHPVTAAVGGPGRPPIGTNPISQVWSSGPAPQRAPGTEVSSTQGPERAWGKRNFRHPRLTSERRPGPGAPSPSPNTVFPDQGPSSYSLNVFFFFSLLRNAKKIKIKIT